MKTKNGGLTKIVLIGGAALLFLALSRNTKVHGHFKSWDPTAYDFSKWLPTSDHLLPTGGQVSYPFLIMVIGGGFLLFKLLRG